MQRQAFADAQAALPFVIAQGRNIEREVYMRRYPAYNYAAHIPVVTEGNAWAIGTTFFTVDTAGEAKFLSGNGVDMPKNQVTHDQASHDFAMIGSGWDWTLEEVNQASMYDFPLNSTKSASATDKVERKLNTIAMSGTTEKSWTGLVNNASVSRTDAAGTGTSSSTFFKDKDVDNILADVNDLLGSIPGNTEEVEWADSVRIPPEAFRDLSTRRLGAGDGMMTVLEYIRKNNIYTAETGQPLSILPLRELATASNDGGGRMIAYRRDPQVVRFHLPMPRRVLRPRQASLMSFEQGIIARTGGTEIRLPGAVAYLDEVTDVPS